MIILAILAIYAVIILLAWVGVNLLFNIAQLVVAIVKRQKAQIVLHSVQLGLTIIAVLVVIAFYLYGDK